MNFKVDELFCCQDPQHKPDALLYLFIIAHTIVQTKVHDHDLCSTVDKDTLDLQEKKVYSDSTCVFICQEVQKVRSLQGIRGCSREIILQ